jgi:hypothetical protein
MPAYNGKTQAYAKPTLAEHQLMHAYTEHQLMPAYTSRTLAYASLH